MYHLLLFELFSFLLFTVFIVNTIPYFLVILLFFFFPSSSLSFIF